jgi:hypothetical protein
MAGAQPSTEDRMSEIAPEAVISRHDKIDANDPKRTCGQGDLTRSK